MSYYDGTKLLSLKDIDGKTPEIYICTGNRSGGKTVYYNRYVVNRFLRYKEKFILLYRYSYELDEVGDKFFKEIRSLFFPDYVMSAKKRANGKYVELFLEKGEKSYPCGYAIALNSADNIKKLSHLLNDGKRILFDEFQSETNHYCHDEINKFISIHTSIARGEGETSRYLPVFMISNFVSLLNPYYCALGISARLQEDTTYLRGNGWVLEQKITDSASLAQQNSTFNQAFGDNKYIVSASEKIYLNDSKTMISNYKGKTRYICTLVHDGIYYGIRVSDTDGIIYCDDRADKSAPIYGVTGNDIDIGVRYISYNRLLLDNLRTYMNAGAFRFKNYDCKNVIFMLLSY